MIRKNTVDFNIEYAHIYTNESFSDEHLKSIKILQKILQDFKKQNKTYSLAILIDDYNPSESILDVKGFVNKLSEVGAEPDYVGYEAKLASLSEMLIKKLPNRLRKQYLRYINRKNRIPCSLLVTIWHLLRLGLLESDIKYFEQLSKHKPFIGKNIITILPARFKNVEEKARTNIASLGFKDKIKNMEFIFF